jgi:sugar lactone lactonase YvrE
MTPGSVTVIDAPLSILGEGPMWSAREQSLYWIDIVGKAVHRLSAVSGGTESRSLPYAPAAVFPRNEGGLLLVTKKGLAVFDFDRNAVQSVPVPNIDFSVELFNDGRCDRHGRLWIGTRHTERTEPKGGLYCLTPDLRFTRKAPGYILANGLAWSPDEKTLYHIDTRLGCVFAYDFDAVGGEVGNRRTFIRYDANAGHPDGCAIDADGGLWIAEVGASRVARYAPDGRLDREIRLPVTKPTSVMFGGSDLSTLYITSMRFGLDNQALAKEPLAGAVLAVAAGVRGIPERLFGEPASAAA